MKQFFKTITRFWKTLGHKIFTFLVGLAFVALVCFCIGRAALAFYRVFVPTGIYTDPVFKTTLTGSSVYETPAEEEVEEGSAAFFESYLKNFVMQDMPDFGEPNDLNDEYIISYGIWQAVTLNNYQSVYTYNKNGSFRVPRSDVETFAQYNLDFPRKIEHRTVDVCGRFKYNALNKTYTVPAANLDSYLVPDVVDVKEGENDTYVVTIDCYEGSSLTQNPENSPEDFRRRIKVTVQDMGVQNYNAETGTPIRRYAILSSETVHEPEQAEPQVDLN